MVHSLLAPSQSRLEQRLEILGIGQGPPLVFDERIELVMSSDWSSASL